MFEMHNKRTVPSFEFHNAWTVPAFKITNNMETLYDFKRLHPPRNTVTFFTALALVLGLLILCLKNPISKIFEFEPTGFVKISKNISRFNLFPLLLFPFPNIPFNFPFLGMFLIQVITMKISFYVEF